METSSFSHASKTAASFLAFFRGLHLGLHPKSTVSDSARHSQSLQASFGVISKARSLQTSALSEDEKRSAKEE